MSNRILILFFVCFSSILIPFGLNKCDTSYEKSNSEFRNIQLTPGITAENNAGETGLSDKKCSLKILKNNPEKKFISIKRPKNKSSSEYIYGTDSYHTHIHEISSEIHTCNFVNLAYLKFLRVTKMLC
ncbi:MAG TPA: hypothetical protein PKC91_02780 [Ignavibacteria bacterium]|nr:hypothetical protein [Ignavibacteria bacterium]